MDIHDQETESPSRKHDPARTPGETFGRYRDLQLIGEGGMAHVYRAFDPTLDREVALKFIRGDDPELAQRLLLEARSQARIEHKHVCKVYEAGEIEGRPYISMQLIEGRTLGTLEELSLEQKLKLMVEVADAVHAAHRVGLIHRDLKPANILVERSTEGEWIPYVMDFGLAREVAAPGLTATGVVVGSPWYMSPEQARGDVRALDRRSDVYSLGATLYHLVSGKLPFEGVGTVNVLLRVINEEPVSLTRWNRSIPADLNAIVMKCLEKDPSRRYESARMLADDLQRYLNGETVRARPAGLLYRMSKQVRRHRVAFASVFAAIVAVAVFGLLALTTNLNAARQARIAHEFGQVVKDMEWRMRVVHMVPLHDIRKEKNDISRRMGDIRREMAAAGDLAAGPGAYALGRGEMALGDFRSARLHLEDAWKHGYRGEDAAFALGLTLSELYRQELLQLEKVRNDALRAARLQELQNELRRPAMTYLSRSKHLDPGYREFVEGLLAFYDGQNALALQKADSAIQHLPWMYEALTLKGDVYSGMHHLEVIRGDEARSEEANRKAEESYLAAQRIGQSDPEVYRSLCSMRANRMSAKYFEGEDLSAYFEGAVQACEDARKVDPEIAAVAAELCGVYRVWAEYQTYLGASPQPILEQAEQYGNRALELDPAEARTHAAMAALYRVRAEYEQEHGGDAEKFLDLTFRYQGKAVELSPKDATIQNGMGNAYLVRALNRYMKGEDVRPDSEQAAAYYRRSLELVPGYSNVLNNLGTAHAVGAWYRMEHGLDPMGAVGEATRYFEEAMRRQPENETPYYNLGILYRRVADMQILRGEDPSVMIAKARRTFEQEIRVNPDPAGDVYAELGAVFLAEAQWALNRQVTPETAVNEAVRLLQKARTLRPDLWNAHQWLGDAYLVNARWKLLQGEDPVESFRLAFASLEEGVKTGTGIPDVRLSLANGFRYRAEWKLSRNTPVESDLQSALKLVEEAISLNPGYGELYGARGALLLMEMRSRDSQDRCGDAQRALEKALALNSFLRRKYEPVLLEAGTRCGS